MGGTRGVRIKSGNGAQRETHAWPLAGHSPDRSPGWGRWGNRMGAIKENIKALEQNSTSPRRERAGGGRAGSPTTHTYPQQE